MTAARDFSQLASLLAEQTASPVKKAKARALTPANDNKPARPLLAWPAFERLAHRGDHPRLYALRHWRDLIFPQQVVIAEDTTDYEPEAATEIRPSEAELLGAVGWKVIKRDRWPDTGELMNVYEPTPNRPPELRTNRNGDVEAKLGSLMFRNGELRQWAETSKGKPLRPVERSRGVKGSSEPSRTESEVRSYLRLKGATSPLAAQPYLKPMSAEPAINDCYSPLPREEPSESDRRGRYGVVEARKLLTELGVAGCVPFEELPFPAIRCADGLIGGAQWVGGVKQPKPTASEPAGREFNFVSQFETVDYVRYLQERLGKHAPVLNMAITDTSAAQIGIAMGLAPAYAAKRGVTLIDEAIDKLIEIDETARCDFGVDAEKVAA